MSSAEDFRVRTSVAQGKVRELTVSAVDFGEKWPESLAKYDRDTSSWKTHQCSLFGGLESFSEHWHKWGIMQGGEYFPLLNVEPCTYVSEYSYLPLPTPNATDYKGGTNKPRKDNGKLRLDQMRHWWKITTDIHAPDPNFTERLMLFPALWTDLRPLATHKFRKWLHSHGRFYQATTKQEDAQC